MAPANKRLELDQGVIRKSRAVLEKALGGGNSLTRSELRDRLDRAGIAGVTGQRLGHLVMQHELDGVLCSGPRRGKQFTYALLEERVPAAPARERDEALAELTRRYFATRGPATARDYAWWAGLTIADAKRGIDLAGAFVERVTIADTHYWRAADRGVPRKAPSAHLLPNYDEYFIGFRDRSAIGARIGNTAPVMVTNALVPHIMIVDGQLVGTWKREVVKDTVVVAIRQLTRLTRLEQDRVAAAAERYARFLGLRLAE
jgi:hypothetical protein